ncbi:LacI family DNA-binding transcriptional regulator [Sphingomonas populi]|uniref:LacI family DNA-binding transcriptional regulator n=1 Tax=Sphingomonas populi TaxID=2484750 RepID=A0A4V2DDC8_9SPHN|nr:LacI family DNA-binding transcriptional regulator [Sphingomonas populi]RZF64538.1 LacI family DNA-binding transcriptional regulator [Sphingomonas populi]
MKRTTIVDVGRLAGVSAKTVSRVLNDEPHVSPAVKQRVREAADALDYHPNVFAQALVRRKSNMIGLIYENPSPSYVVELQRGVLERLTGERYKLVVIPIRSVQDHAGEVVGMLRSAALDGVVLAPPASDNPIILNQLKDARILCARIAPTRLIDMAPSNLIDDVAAAREIADYVIGLGHREIAIIRGDPTHASTEARMLGYTQAFYKADIELRLERIEPGLFTFDSGLAAARDIFARGDRPTAILAQNDDMAVGAMMAAREFGLSIPDDVSVVGFDDSEMSRITWPRLTTVRQPVFEMAIAATEMLIAQLEGRDVTARITHPHELLIRESAAPPRSLG